MTTKEGFESFTHCLERIHAEQKLPHLFPSLEQLKSRRHMRTMIAEYEVFLSYLKPHSMVLDFGTGLGGSAVPFAAAGHTVQAVDIDHDETPASLGHNSPMEYYTDIAGQQRVFWPALANQFKNITFSHYRQSLPGEFLGAFDAVNAFGVLEHVPDPMLSGIIETIKLAIKPGGLLFIDYLPRRLAACERLAGLLRMPRHDRLWGDHEAVDFLTSHGFQVLEFRRIVAMPHHPYWLSNRLEWVFNAIDACATRHPFDLFNHHMRIVAQKLPIRAISETSPRQSPV